VVRDRLGEEAGLSGVRAHRAARQIVGSSRAGAQTLEPVDFYTEKSDQHSPFGFELSDRATSPRRAVDMTPRVGTIQRGRIADLGMEISERRAFSILLSAFSSSMPTQSRGHGTRRVPSAACSPVSSITQAGTGKHRFREAKATRAAPLPHGRGSERALAPSRLKRHEPPRSSLAAALPGNDPWGTLPSAIACSGLAARACCDAFVLEP